MHIWSTSIPTPQDYPIWAFTDSDSEVILLRYHEDFGEPITWCHASIPRSPESHVGEKYEELIKTSTGQAWGTYEWFRAGYRYGKEQIKLSDDCECCQDKKGYEDRFSAPWIKEDPYESAFDERL